MSDIDTVAVDSLKALDPNGPIREADMSWRREYESAIGSWWMHFSRWASLSKLLKLTPKE